MKTTPFLAALLGMVACTSAAAVGKEDRATMIKAKILTGMSTTSTQYPKPPPRCATCPGYPKSNPNPFYCCYDVSTVGGGLGQDRYAVPEHSGPQEEEEGYAQWARARKQDRQPEDPLHAVLHDRYGSRRFPDQSSDPSERFSTNAPKQQLHPGDPSWQKGYSINEATQLTKNRPTKPHCYKLCVDKGFKTCAWQCNGCWGSPLTKVVNRSPEQQATCEMYATVVTPGVATRDPPRDPPRNPPRFLDNLLCASSSNKEGNVLLCPA